MAPGCGGARRLRLRRSQQRPSLPRDEPRRRLVLAHDLARALPLGPLPLRALRAGGARRDDRVPEDGARGAGGVRAAAGADDALGPSVPRADDGGGRRDPPGEPQAPARPQGHDRCTLAQHGGEGAVSLARRLGFRGEELEAIEIGALLHDIGKIGIPEQILRKPAPLDDGEWDVVKTHPVISDYILSELELHPLVRQCARSSHERIDGLGYPDALAGDEIPLPARIVLVADAFDALTSARPYRPARSTLAALAEIREHAGTQFCPQVVAALEELARTEPSLVVPEPAAQMHVASQMHVA
ncbi:MAG: HD domain-containing protein [Actinobacteria bacterium]|nr:MAG: HD domain-containing protein [Actinomycetota bacterium]